MFQFVYKIQFYQITVIISLRGRCVLTPGKYKFKSVIFQIENLKVISIFTSSFSLLLTFVKSSGFPLESLPNSEIGIYPKVLSINHLEEKHFCETCLVLWQYFEIATRICLITFYPNISEFWKFHAVSRISMLATFTMQYNLRLITHLTILPM